MTDKTANNGRTASSGNFHDPDATHLLRKHSDNRTGKITHEVTVTPRDQVRVLLGTYTEANPAKGFSIEFDPEPNPKDSIVTQITSLGTARKYRLVLHIANFSNKPTVAIVVEL